ncbi:MAG: L,D-transpeptidase [Anaerolineae bacterium]|nr:L,D-transpeptidase [Anaerolineae bacterium]
MSTRISRREFFKLGLASVGAMAFNPYLQTPQLEAPDTGKLVRIATKSLSVYGQPDDESSIMFQRFRDELVNVYYETISNKGPDYNPVWYRVWGGYLHRSHTQPVENHLNMPLSYVPNNNQLTEVSVPFTQSMTFKKQEGWQNLYRLYYQSTHWIRDVAEGPDGEPWYRIEDEADSHYTYFVPAAHLRPIPDDELTPLSPEVDQWKKRIEISISKQTLTAYENDKAVLQTTISSGMQQPRVEGQISTKTPIGQFNVEIKMPSKHMGEGFMTDDVDAYELPGVPWCSFFVPDIGVAIHGTYWHTNYGTPMSHGCINMRPEEAKWIYRWTMPVAKPEEWQKLGYGTPVTVMA